MTGAVIGARYRLARLLGRGGMGTVWAAEDTATGQRVAIKLMNDATDPLARRRFLREARAASSVRHSHVVTILDVVDAPGEAPAIVMELLEGESLRARLERVQRIALPALADILVPVVSAVGEAHAHGLVHRDLKPENIFLAGDAADALVKVLDFGIATWTVLDDEAMRSTGLSTGVVLGTPAYMAPEQVFAEKDLDHRADIWALGVVLYECFSGRCPTAGENVGQVFKHVVTRPFTPLDQLIEVPGAISRLVARMLTRERDQRPGDLREVLAVLAPYATVQVPPFAAPPRGAAGDAIAETLDAVSGRKVSALARTIRQDASEAGARGETAREAGLGSGALAETERENGHASEVPVAGAEAVAETARTEGQESGAVAETARAAGLGSEAARKEAPESAALVRRAPTARPRWPVRRVAAAAAVLVAGIAGGWWRLSCVRAASPLADPGSKLACPVLRAAGVDPPAGWLGAAAAAVACERARVLLGGDSERVVTPAELLSLPRSPADVFPLDPYGQDGARERSVTAAQQRAQAYLDGEVTWHAEQLTVALSLRTADGKQLAAGVGRDRGLYAAVRAAMAALVGRGRIPHAHALIPEIAAWQRTADVDAALALVDLTFAFAHNAGGLAEECRRFEAASGPLQELGVEGRWMCAYNLGQPLPATAVAATEASSTVAQAVRIRTNHVMNPQATTSAGPFLRDVVAAATTPRSRGLAAATESCLLSGDDPRARERAISAVQSDPTNPEGGLCNPWDQLMTLERDAMAAEGSIRAMQGWLPWNSYAWFEPGFRSGGKGETLAQLWRAYRLSPFDVQIAGTLAQGVLASGDRAAARGLAADLRSRRQPIYDLQSDIILVNVEASETRFAAALRRARSVAAPSRSDVGWIRAQRFEVAWQAFELAAVLGRAREVADAVAEGFLEPDPSPLDGNATATLMRIPAVCARASVPSRCLARFRALRLQLFTTITTHDTDEFLAGVEHYVQGDFAAAAQAWAPLLAGSMMMASTLPDAMVEVFERTGKADLAAQVDLEVMKRAGELNGATRAHARTAHRMLARGDRAGARKLAERVVEAWSHADEDPPALVEMRQLLAQLPPTPPP